MKYNPVRDAVKSANKKPVKPVKTPPAEQNRVVKQVKRDPEHLKVNICIGLPTCGHSCHSIQRDMLMLATNRSIRVDLRGGNSSSLTGNFNDMWVMAVNGRKTDANPDGYTHFAMMHSDIVPSEFWLDKLIDLLAENHLQVLSVMSPIKDDHGLTSTGFDTDQWRPRRLTIIECMKLPLIVTNTLTDIERCRKIVGDPVGPLLINTGLMLIDMTSPWVEHLCFQFRNRLIRQPDGKLFAEFEPEDWAMSRDLHRWGAPFGFVDGRTIPLGHSGDVLMMNTWDGGRFSKDEYNIPQAGRTVGEVVAGYGSDDDEARVRGTPTIGIEVPAAPL